MSTTPRVDDSGNCTWHPINDLDKAIDKAVIFDSEYGICKDGNHTHTLQRANSCADTILTANDETGAAMPLWRVVILSPTTILIRIDHCIYDGLSGK